MEKLILLVLLIFASFRTQDRPDDSGRNCTTEHTSNRVLLSEAVKPGDRIQIAIFAVNGPISAVPANRIFMREATVEFVR
jgi:hypothetical protein